MDKGGTNDEAPAEFFRTFENDKNIGLKDNADEAQLVLNKKIELENYYENQKRISSTEEEEYSNNSDISQGIPEIPKRIESHPTSFILETLNKQNEAQDYNGSNIDSLPVKSSIIKLKEMLSSVEELEKTLNTNSPSTIDTTTDNENNNGIRDENVESKTSLIVPMLRVDTANKNVGTGNISFCSDADGECNSTSSFGSMLDSNDNNNNKIIVLPKQNTDTRNISFHVEDNNKMVDIISNNDTRDSDDSSKTTKFVEKVKKFNLISIETGRTVDTNNRVVSTRSVSTSSSSNTHNATNSVEKKKAGSRKSSFMPTTDDDAFQSAFEEEEEKKNNNNNNSNNDNDNFGPGYINAELNDGMLIQNYFNTGQEKTINNIMEEESHLDTQFLNVTDKNNDTTTTTTNANSTNSSRVPSSEYSSRTVNYSKIEITNEQRRSEYEEIKNTSQLKEYKKSKIPEKKEEIIDNFDGSVLKNDNFDILSHSSHKASMSRTKKPYISYNSQSESQYRNFSTSSNMSQSVDTSDLVHNTQSHNNKRDVSVQTNPEGKENEMDQKEEYPRKTSAPTSSKSNPNSSSSYSSSSFSGARFASNVENRASSIRHITPTSPLFLLHPNSVAGNGGIPSLSFNTRNMSTSSKTTSASKSFDENYPFGLPDDVDENAPSNNEGSTFFDEIMESLKNHDFVSIWNKQEHGSPTSSVNSQFTAAGPQLNSELSSNNNKDIDNDDANSSSGRTPSLNSTAKFSFKPRVISRSHYHYHGDEPCGSSSRKSSNTISNTTAGSNNNSTYESNSATRLVSRGSRNSSRGSRNSSRGYGKNNNEIEEEEYIIPVVENSNLDPLRRSTLKSKLLQQRFELIRNATATLTKGGIPNKPINRNNELYTFREESSDLLNSSDNYAHSNTTDGKQTSDDKYKSFVENEENGNDYVISTNRGLSGVVTGLDPMRRNTILSKKIQQQIKTQEALLNDLLPNKSVLKEIEEKVGDEQNPEISKSLLLDNFDKVIKTKIHNNNTPRKFKVLSHNSNVLPSPSPIKGIKDNLMNQLDAINVSTNEDHSGSYMINDNNEGVPNDSFKTDIYMNESSFINNKSTFDTAQSGKNHALSDDVVQNLFELGNGNVTPSHSMLLSSAINTNTIANNDTSISTHFLPEINNNVNTEKHHGLVGLGIFKKNNSDDITAVQKMNLDQFKMNQEVLVEPENVSKSIIDCDNTKDSLISKKSDVHVTSPFKVVTNSKKADKSIITASSDIDENDVKAIKKVTINPVPQVRTIKKVKKGMKDMGELYIQLHGTSKLEFFNNFKERKAEYCIVFDNGINRIETPWVHFEDNDGIYKNLNKEFETVLPLKDVLQMDNKNIIKIVITLKCRYAKPADKIVEVREKIPIKIPGVELPQKKQHNFLFGLKHGKHLKQQKKKYSEPIIEYQTVVRRVLQPSNDKWKDKIANDGSFAVSVITIDEDFLSGCEYLKAPKTFNLINKWGVKLNNYHKLNSDLSFQESKNCIGQLYATVCYLPRLDPLEKFPKTLDKAEKIVQKWLEQESVHYEGWLYQEGGDIDQHKMMTKRYFKLNGPELIGYHEITKRAKCVINLLNVDYIDYYGNTKSDNGRNVSNPITSNLSFQLVFKNKESITFTTESKSQRNEWLMNLNHILELNIAHQPWVKKLAETLS
ncbi:Bud4p SCDLUD_000096 [Saccharomycodes ludwigii]|uniref:Bud4p n=1 Tax=Saccharomycodes ludwigii TaxID=36035 RepID=UPI001E889834|nr:hypothetical protein SCDLUD_000096 [Saccharomycodes ludwigii]KAH3902518.1 hypothetical protein SCDLUD_000096 [Saccharomycodes ludwigii]